MKSSLVDLSHGSSATRLFALFVACSFSLAIGQTLDLGKQGIPPANINRTCEEPVPLYGLSYVGTGLLLVTFTQPCFNLHSGTAPFTALLMDHSGQAMAQLNLEGSPSSIAQRAFPTQPEHNVLFRLYNQIRVYDLELKTYTDVPITPQDAVRLTPDRAQLAVVSQDGAEAHVSVSGLRERQSTSRHLPFNELAVRRDLIAVSNSGVVAHAVGDPDTEFGVMEGTRDWSTPPPTGKYLEPLAFTPDGTLLLSPMSRRPFPPTYLYLWSPNGLIRQVRSAASDGFSLAQVSLDGTRALVSTSHVNLLAEALNGFDCGNCGDHYTYTFIDLLHAKRLREFKPNSWCRYALSPDGHEIAELCGDKLKFIQEP